MSTSLCRKLAGPRAALGLALAVLLGAGGCVTPETAVTPEYMYVTPILAYLRACPEYSCKIVGEVYGADQVEVLEKQGDWQRVRPTGQQTDGWIQGELLSRGQVAAEKVYVTVKDLPLRDGAGMDFPYRVKLQPGDAVQKIDSNHRGWWRVLAVKDKSSGWIPAQAVSASYTPPAAAAAPAPAQAGGKPLYFAATPDLKLYSLPLFSSRVVKELPLNDKVEKLAQSGEEWLRVRHLASGAEGWVAARFLSETRVSPPPARKAKAKPRKKTAPPPAATEAPASEAPAGEEPETVAPEAM